MDGLKFIDHRNEIIRAGKHHNIFSKLRRDFALEMAL